MDREQSPAAANPAIGRYLVEELLDAGPAPAEASADIRAAAKSLRELYVGLISEGFTMHEAMELLAAMSRGGAP